jgi:hypothetical protein
MYKLVVYLVSCLDLEGFPRCCLYQRPVVSPYEQMLLKATGCYCLTVIPKINKKVNLNQGILEGRRTNSADVGTL